MMLFALKTLTPYSEAFDSLDHDNVRPGVEEQDDKALLICQLLPNLNPLFLIGLHFPFPPTPGTHRLDRIFVFDFLPASLYPNIIVRTLRSAVSLLSIWRSGVVANVRKHNSVAMIYLSICYAKG